MKYVYRCVETGEEKELELTITLMTEELLHGWTDADGRTWKRVYTAPAIHFRGLGWAGKS